MAKLCIALGLCAAAAFFSLSQFATRRGRQGDDVKALCSWLTSSSVPERVRQWALTSPLLNCAALLSQQRVASTTPTIAAPLEDQHATVFPASTVLSTESWPLDYDEFTSTRLQEEPEQEVTTTLSSAPPVMTLKNVEATESEASTQFLTDSWPSNDDASTYTSQISSHIEEYQTGWSGKATYSEALLSVQRKQDTIASLDDNLLDLNQDSGTTYFSVSDKNVKPKEVMTPKPAFIADQHQDRQATLRTEPILQSSNDLDREITTIPFSSLNPTSQQRETINGKPVTEFDVKSEDKVKISTVSFLLPATGEDVTTEFVTPETTYSNLEKQEALSTISGLPTVLRQGDKQQFSQSTTPVESDMEEHETTTSLPSEPSLAPSKLERDANFSISTFDVSVQHSTELPIASKTSTDLDAQTEKQTTVAPLPRNTVSEAQTKDVPTADSLSGIPSRQPETDISSPYTFVQSHDQRGTIELSSFLPVYTSTVANLKTVLPPASDVVSQSEQNTHAYLPFPESPTTPNDMYIATTTALPTPTLVNLVEEVETMESTTKDLSLEHQEETTHASEPLFEPSSSLNKQDSTTPSSLIASPFANVELATTTEPTPEEPEGPKIVCYFHAWSFFRRGRGHYTPEDIDPLLCTHIIYACASLDNDSLHIASADYNADIKNNLYNRTLALKAVNRRLKVLLSLGGWDGSTSEDKYSSLAANSTARRSFARHAATFVAEHRFDGLDVDWEYPNCVGGECRDNTPDKRNFVLLLQDIREAFDMFNPPLLLTAAIAGNVEVIRKAYHVAEMFNVTDFVSVMAYDYFGTQNPVVAHYSPLQSATGETNPEMSIEYVVKTLIAMGAPAEKLVLGVPFYARSYTLANPRLNYIGAPTKGKGEPGLVTGTPGILAYYEICSAIKAGGWTTMMDPRAGVYAYSGDQWVCFDGPRSLMRKARFALKMGLAGLMASDLSMDDFRGQCGRKGPLLNAIHRVLYPPKTTAVAKGSG